MELFLETRGSARTTGYRFLGAQPGGAWWRRYGRHTSFEYPTVLVESDARGVRAYLGAIPSSRSDTEGATNRVTIVVESPPIANDEDRRLVTGLVGAWVTDIAAGGHRLRDALDMVFDESTVARLYGGTEDDADEVRKRILDVARALEPVSPSAADTAPTAWIAPARARAAREAFLVRVEELVAANRTGVALLVNLAADASAFAAEAAHGAAILVNDPAGELADELRPIAAARPAAAGQPSVTESPGRSPGKGLAVLSRGTAKKVAWVILALAIVVISVVVATRSGAD